MDFRPSKSLGNQEQAECSWKFGENRERIWKWKGMKNQKYPRYFYLVAEGNSYSSVTGHCKHNWSAD